MAGVNVRVLLRGFAACFVNKCSKIPEMANGKRIDVPPNKLRQQCATTRQGEGRRITQVTCHNLLDQPKVEGSAERSSRQSCF